MASCFFCHFLVYLKERNDEIFRGSSSSLDKLFHAMLLRLAKWVSIQKEFKEMNVDNILFN